MKFLKKLFRIALIGSLGSAIILFNAPKKQKVRLKKVINTSTLSPNIKAFLDTIAHAEGTLHPHGYRTLYGGERFYSFRDHPRTVISSTSRKKTLSSSAAGRYQILAKTWDHLAPTIGAQSFAPINQDKAAILLLERAGALESIKKGNFERAIKQAAKTWSSLPGGPYNQPVVNLATLKKIYLNRLFYYTQLAKK